MLRLPCALGLLVGLAGGLSQATAQPDDTAAEAPPDAPASDAPAATPSSTAATPDAASLERQLGTIFQVVDEFAELRARVRHGVVRLTGTVPGPAARERAVELARSLPGVVYVDDDIDDAPPVEERVEPMLARARERGNDLLRRLPVVGLALLVVLPFGLLAALLRRWDAPFRLVARRKLVRALVQRITATAIVLIGIVLALDVLDAATIVGAVLGAAGVLGIALGFAFRDIVENYLASILLGVRRPFAVGDHVCIGDHPPAIVVGLNTRETLLMTYDGNHLTLPNAIVFKSELTNLTRNPKRRLDFVAGVGPADDLALAQRVGVETLRAGSGVLADPPPFARVEELGDSSVAVRFHAWIDQRHTDWYKARSECIRRVKMALDEAGVELPEPSYRLTLRSAGDAPRPRPELADAATAGEDVRADDHLDQQVRAERTRHADDLMEDGEQPSTH